MGQGSESGFQHVTRTILRGLVTVIPVAATLYVVGWLAVSAEWIMGLAVRAVLPDEWYWPGMGLALTLPLLYGVGWAFDHWLLRGFIDATEALLARTPLVNKVFNAVQDLISYFRRDRNRNFDQVVSLELAGVTVLGLVTRHDLRDRPLGLRSDDRLAVYIPGSYQIGGFTVNVPRERLTAVAMTVEDALRYAVTGGMSYKARIGTAVDDAGAV
ncbi:MAG: DUF502 domain-containing protein [Gammaproteobacteria bacterium]|nr:DUF502 domain-containing protein [Gammaproteobacteria bacterium]